jgi:4a-hydroxytetrahydrobiopterin dehydratase
MEKQCKLEGHDMTNQVGADLSAKRCKPCEGGMPPLAGEQLQEYARQVQGWEIPEEKKLVKTFKFPDFRKALEFTNRVGELAEREGHHPDIFLSWGKVRIELSTHKIKGLSENDFVLAAKIDQLPK